MLRKLFYIFLMTLPLSCIDPYKVDLVEGEQLLTVDGFIHTDPGPHTIKLTRTDTYGSVFEGLIRPVRQATVSVRDSQGLVTFLTEVEAGQYQTPNGFRVIPGLSYTLQIRLLDGKQYSSFPEVVHPVAPIDQISFRSVRLATENRLEDRFGVEFFAHFKDPSDQVNYYYWRMDPSVFVLVTNPELFTNPATHPTNPRGPAPKDCCDICFLVEKPRIQQFAIASDENFNGLNTVVPVAFIEDNGLRFKDTYRAEFLQMGISQGAHRFLRLIDQQLSITGSVFDQPPANIRGNIISLDNPDEKVLGYFIAASVQRSTVYVKRSDLEFRALPRIIPDDCRTVSNASITPPANWNPGD
ncbi:DUF4249 domain-containing protein [Cecembia rubra]|uniref:Uncharacterized protein DUF4249 n=1 Tax=Cecembia rubra TaxID=1485585 RepID=A0A2P8E8B4_9BACT|nr:DUF4249 domain-containing protein [Cecembia rubra]PSL05726.1 uncharacterized protein DUF4249 [Cecembia rubra]